LNPKAGRYSGEYLAGESALAAERLKLKCTERVCRKALLPCGFLAGTVAKVD